MVESYCVQHLHLLNTSKGLLILKGFSVLPLQLRGDVACCPSKLLATLSLTWLTNVLHQAFFFFSLCKL